ncbi:AN1-type zinc finger protein 2A OS=Mus musculus GN=Zfand2a PE=2 SV=1 [Rhizoctonia solani AG-1 IB]|uniref:AN1-type zinc finger protein 2A n=2 Tax=Thanatephorus cucumeris (strain AG1-IB / isolate 7/3/14) TaxID=1108050 RepID=A0A0B7FXJ1_THACB|nr:AN1-type zinc finger protein 2A OS=Mus musculus GN=Zfand2a PE=2 SV=1 [Rhizoctonia solani AG-1 IB]
MGAPANQTRGRRRASPFHHILQPTRHPGYIKLAMATRKDSTDAQMLFVGSACSLANCNQHDFLPIKCNLCSATFCSDHFRPDGHNCSKFDPAKADRVAPSCPLCSTPVSIPLGQDPNLKMDTHIMNECTAMGNRANTRQAKRCAGPRCTKVLIAPIRCDNCRKEFCPEHRFPQQHTCAAASAKPSSSPAPTPQPVMSKLTDKLSGVSVGGIRAGQSSASASAAMAAINRAAASARPAPKANVAPKPKPTPSSSEGAGSSKPAVHNPFNKTDRRAKAERLSQLRGLQQRNRKGLLSEAEKARLAELESEAKKDGDCVLM